MAKQIEVHDIPGDGALHQVYSHSAAVTGIYIQNLTNIPLRWTCADTPDPDKTLLVPPLEPYEAPLGNDLYVRVAAGGAGQVAVLTITGE